MNIGNKGLLVLLSILLVIGCFLGGCYFGKKSINAKNNESKNVENVVRKVKAQISSVDNSKNSTELLDSFDINENMIILFDKYEIIDSANDIKIIEIKDDYVKISRDLVKYNDTSESYVENVIENVKYNEKIDVDGNGQDPNGPLSMSRYIFFIEFVK